MRCTSVRQFCRLRAIGVEEDGVGAHRGVQAHAEQEGKCRHQLERGVVVEREVGKRVVSHVHKEGERRGERAHGIAFL